MFAADRATRCDFVSFSYGVLDHDLNIWKGLPKHPEERLETGWTAERFTTLIRETVRNAILCKHLVDCFFPSLVPYLLKPATDEGLIVIWHFITTFLYFVEV